MRQLGAVLFDSLREALDRKLFLALLLLTSLPIIFCFGVSFEREPVETTLRNLANRLDDFRVYTPRQARRARRFDAKISIGDVRPIEPGEEDWPEEVRGGHAVDLSFSDSTQLDQLVRALGEFANLVISDRTIDDRKEPAEGAAPATEEQKIAFLRDRFQEFGFNCVHARRLDSAPDTEGGARPGGRADRFLVAVKSDYPHEVRGAHTLSLIFGAFSHIDLSEVSIAEFTVGLQDGLAQVFAGTLVMIVAIVATAGFVPDMLRKGTLDLVLARPIGRVRLLLFKYLGGLWFIAIFAAILVVGCWIALSLRTGYVNPWFLVSIVTVTLIFAVLYSVSVLFGVRTRSAGISALLSLGVWGMSSIVVNARHTIKMMLWGTDIPASLGQVVDVLYAILPKTKDIGLLSTYALSRSYLSPQAYERTFAARMPPVDWLCSLGTTALFTAAMLGLAAWIFRRRDW